MKMRSALRASAALGLVLCGSLLPATLADYNGENTDNTDTHHPCTNSFNGNVSSATDINGAHIVGCGTLRLQGASASCLTLFARARQRAAQQHPAGWRG
jgi:hypothetical protein